MPRVEVPSGAKLYYELRASDDRPTVMFLSGGGTAGSVWMPQVSAYVEQYSCLIFDYRGVGRSSGAPGPYSVLSLAYDALALMDHLEIAKAHVIGVSLGSAVALVLALEAPRRVITLQLHGAFAARRDRDKPWGSVVSRTFEAGGVPLYEDLAFVRWFPAQFIASEPDRALAIYQLIKSSNLTADAMRGQLAAIASHDVTQRLGEINHPTLITVGELDMVTPLAYASELNVRIRGSDLVVVPRVGHMIGLQDPAAFNRLTLEWMAKQVTRL